MMRRFLPYALRDVALLGVTLLGWFMFGPLSAEDGLLADFSGALLGVMAGACAWQAHEWGHCLGAIFTRSTLRHPKTLWSVYLFGFDKTANKKYQFVAMALGGFAATAVIYLGLLPLLPEAWLATRVFYGLVLMEIALIFVLEVPGLILGIFAYSRLPSVDVLPQDD